MEIKEGFYEKIVSKELIEALDGGTYKFLAPIFSKTDGSILIQRYFQDILTRALNQINEERDEIARKKIIDFANALISLTAKFLNDSDFENEKIEDSGRVLRAIFQSSTYSIPNIEEHFNEVFPITGLSESALFNGSKHTPSLESELKKEMLTTDEVWWLVSFLKFEGVRLFEQVFRKLEQTGKRVKIICTVYMGATDIRAIDFLSQFSNIDIKISYNTNQERLHAKAYLFIRNSGFHTAYIGSSNLSRSALTNGLEWNLKVTQQEIPHIIIKCRNTFETYWNDNNFELYNKDLHRDKLVLSLEKRNLINTSENISKFFDLKPFPFQQEILDQIEKCRLNGENRNLIVAATGTGKTVISAFDFRRFKKGNPKVNFLFIAHREEILIQARYTFRQILKDNDFGDLWHSGHTPKDYSNLFVSVQTLNNRLETLQLENTFYDYIIIDEVHHSGASSYQKILAFYKPQILLGLTATPERHDGFDISNFFGNLISAEIRLPEALNQKLLCPFQYFGISDSVDISRVSWRRGKYDINELEKAFSEDDRRVNEILRNCNKYLKDFQDVRALGFCVSKKHAEFMSEQFNLKGIKSAFLHSDNTSERRTILQSLIRKDINYLFVVDVFNEGVDIPEIDTLLFLRPTESLTIFLQQLGRGLRLHDDKTCLTVLDFVGRQNVEYSFEHKFRAMIGKTHSKIKDELQNDFPNLPLGCSITLEETAKEIIFKNISSHFGGGERSILRAIGRFLADYKLDLSLKNFCDFMGYDLHAIYRSKHLFYELKNNYYNISFKRNENYKLFLGVLGNTWLTTDSESYFRFLLKFITDKEIDVNSFESQQYLIMFYVDLYNSDPNFKSYKELKEHLIYIFQDKDIEEELINFLNYRLEQVICIEKPIVLKVDSVLKLHGRYSRNQILSAFSENSLIKKASSREGVYRIKSLNTELLFVTLYKDEGRFNASTMYNDYFINENLFHWQSQNSTSPESNVGRSYINQLVNKKDVLLFIREATLDENGLRMSFIFCGKLEFLKYEGKKPMSITWKLLNTPPALLLQEGKKLEIG